MTDIRITSGKGVHVTFDNGVTISIQIGGGNYADNYDFPIGQECERLPASRTAEIAVWDANSTWVNLNGDQVAGWVTVNNVLRIMSYLQSLPVGVKAENILVAETLLVRKADAE